MRIRGIRQAIRHMETRERTFKTGVPYIHSEVSAMMANAIRTNADPSYNKSHVKAATAKTAKNWNVGGSVHMLKILSAAYANYRQYGCGGLEIKKLVVVTQADIERGRQAFEKAFLNP